MLQIVDWAKTDILKSVVLQLQSQTKPSSKFRHVYHVTSRIVPEDFSSLTSLW
jgi:hypothetical protein